MQGEASDQAGLFIAVEGGNEQVVSTQCRLLCDRLRHAGREVVLLDFPRREETSSYFVRQYLSGSYGPLANISPYTATLFYALDRYQNRDIIRRAVADGKIVIASHSVGATMAEQGSKIAHPEERRGFFIWLDNLETYVLGATRPTCTFVLRSITDATLHPSSKTYDEICHQFPKDFILIDGIRDGINVEPADLHAILWGKIEPLLPVSAAQAALAIKQPKDSGKTEVQTCKLSILAQATLRQRGTPIVDATDRPIVPFDSEQWFYVPRVFDDTTREHYIKTMHELRQLYDDLTDKLSAYVASRAAEGQSGASIDTAVARALQTTLPLATLLSQTLPATDKTKSDTIPEIDVLASKIKTDTKSRLGFDIASFARDNLPPNYTGQSEPIKLIGVWPRNELDLVPDFLYEYSDQPLDMIQREVANWSYQRKADVLRTCMRASLAQAKTNDPLAKVRYTLDIVSDFATLQLCLNQTNEGISWQSLSPRLGYEVPAIVDEANLADEYERCFDISLGLHSYLQQAGFNHEAQYGCLLGHRIRWSLVLTAQELSNLDGMPYLNQLIINTLSEIHPLIGQCLYSAQPARDQQMRELQPA